MIIGRRRHPPDADPRDQMLAFISYRALVKIHLGPLAISPHGIGIAVGFVAGSRLLLPAARARGIPDTTTSELLTLAAIGAAIGARVAFVVNHLGDFDNPLQWFAVWHGGISLLGGIFGAILMALPAMRRHHIDFWQIMDAAAPGLALGILIGRVGDLVVGDHLGKPTSFVLGYRCEGHATASPCDAPIGQAVHMPALYDFIDVAILLGVLLWLRRRPRATGFLILVFGAWYGVGRIAEDFFRVDETHGLGLTGSQWAALITVIACVAKLVVLVRSSAAPTEVPVEAG